MPEVEPAVKRSLVDAPNQSKTLPRSMPEANGIASSAITAFLEAVEEKRLELHSFMLVRHGQVAAEAWWSPFSPERPHHVFSLSKSFTSTAIGLAVEEGLLSVEDLVISFFPDKPVKHQPYLQELQVKHLLTMTVGHARNAMEAIGAEEDWVTCILNEPIVHEPGTFFVYNNGASYLLSAILQQQTGQSLHDYLQTRLYQPLGIEGATWSACPRGFSKGAMGLSIKTEDIAKFGQLYLQRGNWRGRQLIPESWVNEATSYQVSTGNRDKPDSILGYGYQFWRSRHDSYRGAGAYGQYCLVLPEQDAVIAITAGAKVMHYILDEVWTHLLPAMGETVLPADEPSQDTLLQTASALSYPPLQSHSEGALVDRISGKRYVLEENKAGLQAVEWHFEGEACLAKAWGAQGELQIQCGLRYWEEGVLTMWGGPQKIAASGGWQSPDTFVMRWMLLENVYSEVYTIVFAEDRITIRVEKGAPEPALLAGKLAGE